MGKFVQVRFDEKPFALSMIGWGFLRRYKSNKRGFMRLTGASFIPRYEIAVYDGAPSLSYFAEVVFYYPDKASALQKFDELKAAIAGGGIFGQQFRKVISGAGPHKQHVWLVNPALGSA
jgi:hypothetical protein